MGFDKCVTPSRVLEYRDSVCVNAALTIDLRVPIPLIYLRTNCGGIIPIYNLQAGWGVEREHDSACIGFAAHRPLAVNVDNVCDT